MFFVELTSKGFFCQQLQHSLYSIPVAFECLPCAEGCEACEDGSPCVAALNWVVRTTIFALACLVISCLPFIIYFTIKYGHVRVSTAKILMYVFAVTGSLICKVFILPREGEGILQMECECSLSDR